LIHVYLGVFSSVYAWARIVGGLGYRPVKGAT